MRKCLVLTVLFGGLAQAAAGQRPIVPAAKLPADSLTHRIKFQGVVAVPGVPAAELQGRAREWVALTFQDAHQVTQLDDANRGVLIVRGITTTWVNLTRKFPTTSPLAFTCRLEFRDGRYRYEVFDFGVPLIPNIRYTSGDPVTSGQLQRVFLWQYANVATLAASPRQSLYQPDLDSNPKANDVAALYGASWYEIRDDISQTVTRLIAALRQHETTPPAKW